MAALVIVTYLKTVQDEEGSKHLSTPHGGVRLYPSLHPSPFPFVWGALADLPRAERTAQGG
jgi:hypothetical protein